MFHQKLPKAAGKEVFCHLMHFLLFVVHGNRACHVYQRASQGMTSACRGRPIEECQDTSYSLQDAHVGCRGLELSSTTAALVLPYNLVVLPLSRVCVREHGTAKRIIRSSLPAPPFSEARILTIELPAATALTYLVLFRSGDWRAAFVPQTSLR